MHACMDILMDTYGIILKCFIKNENIFFQKEKSNGTWDFQKVCYNEYKSFI